MSPQTRPPLALVLLRDAALREAVCRSVERIGGIARGMPPEEVVRDWPCDLLVLDEHAAAPEGVLSGEVLALSDTGIPADLGVRLGRATVRREFARLETAQRKQDEVRGAFSALFDSTGPSTGALRRAFRRALHSADPVAVTGPSGSGRSLVARAIHAHSRGVDSPLSELDCKHLSEVSNDIAERDLIAAFDRGGTLILEHAQRLPIELDTAARAAAASSAATRVVAVFDRPREPPPNAREARATLLGWARATLLEIPPLCRRLEDIPHLFEHYARPMGAAGRTPMPTAAALVALLTDSWVGNLREFEEVVRASTKRVAHAGAATVGLTDLHHRFARNPGGNALELLSTAFERGLLAEALASHQGRVIESATSLGVPERTLRATMRRLGLSKEDFKPFVGP